MSTPNDGGPAFPQIVDDRTPMVWSEDGLEVIGSKGMSIRDYFAAKALQGILGDPNVNAPALSIAIAAYEQADAMLKARGQ